MKVSELKIGRPSESGHFYTRAGAAAYDIRGANGVMRPVTLRDARKLNLVPGVSTILAMEAKPALEKWKVQQAILSALTLPRLPGEAEDAYAVRALEDSKEQSRKAADRGTQIHAALQGSFEGRPTTAEDLPYVQPVRDWINQRYGLEGFEAEQSFASPRGYGGKCDLVNRRHIVIADFKVKEFGEEKQAKDLAYPEHVTQLAAYAQGLGLPLDKADAINIFVSRNNPGLIRVREWDQAEIITGWQAFECLLKLYSIRKNFDPSFEVAA